MFNDILFFKNKKEKREPEQNTIKEKHVKEKKKLSTGFYLLISITIIGLVIGGLKFRKYMIEKDQNTITVEEQQSFAQKVRDDTAPKNKISKNEEPEAEMQNVTEKKIEQINLKKELGSYIVNQTTGYLFENDGFKMTVSGMMYKKGDKFYKDFVFDSSEISKGGYLKDAVISLIITHNGEVVQKYSHKLLDIYEFTYYYEGVSIAPKKNKDLATDIIFSNNDIKPNLKFVSFEDDGEKARFVFNIFGETFISIISLDELK